MAKKRKKPNADASGDLIEVDGQTRSSLDAFSDGVEDGEERRPLVGFDTETMFSPDLVDAAGEDEESAADSSSAAEVPEVEPGLNEEELDLLLSPPPAASRRRGKSDTQLHRHRAAAGSRSSRTALIGVGVAAVLFLLVALVSQFSANHAADPDSAVPVAAKAPVASQGVRAKAGALPGAQPRSAPAPRKANDALRSCLGTNLVSLVKAGAAWQYAPHRVLPGAAWLEGGEAAGVWKRGRAPLGSGKKRGGWECRTQVKASNGRQPARCFRRTFTVKDPARVRDLFVKVLREDGVAVYLNGQELLRDNLPDGELTPATTAVKAEGYKQGYSKRVVDRPTTLRAGTNTIAAVVYSHRAEGRNVLFDLALSARMAR